MKNNNIRKVMGLTLVTFLLFISMHFESKRIVSEKELISYNSVHTKIVRLSEEELFRTMSGDAVILFTSANDEGVSPSREALYYTSLISGFEVVYEFDLTHHEGKLRLDDREIIVEKKASELYDDLIERLGSFTEVYALENRNGELVDSGYKKIYTPYVVFIKDGRVICSHYLSSMDDVDKLKDAYLRGFELIKDKNM